MWIKRFLFAIVILSFFGCATLPNQRIDNIEMKIAKLEKQVKTAMASGSGAKTIYGFYGLTGADPALQAIVTTSVENGSYAMGIDSSGYYYIYYFNSSSSATHSPPDVVQPTTGSGRWLLAPRLYATSVYASSMTGSATGDHYMNISNSSHPSFTRTDGDIYNRTDTGVIYVYNSADAENVPFLNTKRKNFTTDITLQQRHLYGATVSNRGATGTIKLTLQKAEYGMEVTVLIASAYRINISPNIADKIVFTSSICSTDGYALYNTGTIGDFVTLRAILVSGSDYDWYVVNYKGTWADGGLL